MLLFVRVAIATSLLSVVLSTLSVYPHQLAYFNELSGGIRGGNQHLLGSNLDWGQDLLFLKDYQQQHSEQPEPYLFSYSVMYDPRDLGVKYKWPMNQDQGADAPGIYAMAASVLFENPQNRVDSQSRILRDHSPVCMLGASIYVFEIPEQN